MDSMICFKYRLIRCNTILDMMCLLAASTMPRVWLLTRLKGATMHRTPPILPWSMIGAQEEADTWENRQKCS